MKIKNTLLFCSLVVLAACSNDDSQSPDNGLTLHKTISFIPTEEVYNSHDPNSFKNVKYYENNRIIADSTYRENGQLSYWIKHEYTSNTHVAEEHYSINYAPSKTHEFTYDNNNRLIQKKSTLYSTGTPQNSISIETFTYTTESIIRNTIDPDTNLVMPQYTIEYFINDNGLIFHMPYSNNAASNLEFDIDKPLQYSYDNGAGTIWTRTATYYNTSVPLNQRKTIAELNNIILTSGAENVFLECNYYLKSISYQGYEVLFTKTFDNFGNILYSKQENPFVDESLVSETFYYYN